MWHGKITVHFYGMGRRTLHLVLIKVSWQESTFPIQEGGLGIKKLEGM